MKALTVIGWQAVNMKHLPPHAKLLPVGALAPQAAQHHDGAMLHQPVASNQPALAATDGAPTRLAAAVKPKRPRRPPTTKGLSTNCKLPLLPELPKAAARSLKTNITTGRSNLPALSNFSSQKPKATASGNGLAPTAQSSSLVAAAKIWPANALAT